MKQLFQAGPGWDSLASPWGTTESLIGSINSWRRCYQKPGCFFCEKSRRFGDDYFNHVPSPPFPEPQDITGRSRLGKTKSRAMGLIHWVLWVSMISSCSRCVWREQHRNWHRNPSTKGWFPPCRDEWLPAEENDLFFLPLCPAVRCPAHPHLPGFLPGQAGRKIPVPRMSPASSRMDLNIPRAAGEEHFKKENLICAERPQDASCSLIYGGFQQRVYPCPGQVWGCFEGAELRVLHMFLLCGEGGFRLR